MFVAVFVKDTDAQAREFLRTHPVSFPAGYDWELAVAKPLGYWGMPYTVIIAPNGEIVRQYYGVVTEDHLIGEVDTLLGLP
jgi:hypothetical protein